MKTDTQEVVSKTDIKLVEKELTQAEKALVIKTDEDAEYSAEWLIKMRGQVDEAEAKRKEYVQPAQETISRINKDFKKITAPRLDFADKLKEAILVYVRGRKLEVKKAEKKVQKQLGDRSLVLEDGLEKIPTQYGEIRFRKTTEVKLLNKKLIPEKFWVIDEKALKEALEAGVEVPGAKLKEEPIGTLAVYADKE